MQASQYSTVAKMVLTTKDLRIIVNELSEAQVKWYNIGVQLRIDIGELDKIKSDYRDNTENCFREMIKVWLKSINQGSKTWTTLADVLKGPTVGFGDLARQIEERYCQLEEATAAKRLRLTDEQETAATKHSCMEDDQTYGEFSEVKKEKEQLENLIKNKDTLIQNLQDENKKLRDETVIVRQKNNQLERQQKEAVEKLKSISRELQQKTADVQKLQREMSKKELEVQELKGQISKKEVAKSPVQVPSKEKKDALVRKDDDIVLIRRLLHPVRDSWYDIGTELHLSFHTLDNIKKEYSDSKDCLLAMLREWNSWYLYKDFRTLGTLVNALRSPVLGLEELANTVETTYLSRNS